MNTKIRKTVFQCLRTVFVAGLLGLGSGAHALCLNADGSLDDGSMNTAVIDRGLLPACESPQIAPAPAPQSTKPQADMAAPAQQTVTPMKKVKRSDKNASLGGDCRTDSGESRDGSLGAVEMLPACSV